MANADQQQPPYVSFGIFKGAIETLAQTTVPSGPIDRRVLDGLSGADYGALISGLKFLGLVDADRKALPPYKALVHASKAGGADKFKPALLEIINNAYKPVIGKVDVLHGTIAELEKAFKDFGVSQGQMLTKSVRFYIKALIEGGVVPSPHITKPKPPRTAASKKNGSEKKRQIKRRKDEGGDDALIFKVAIPIGFERLPIPGLSGAFIQYPGNITEDNCDLFQAMVGVLRTYAKGRTGKEKKP